MTPPWKRRPRPEKPKLPNFDAEWRKKMKDMHREVPKPEAKPKTEIPDWFWGSLR